jgi:tungstate transport system ATP-binding protein
VATVLYECTAVQQKAGESFLLDVPALTLAAGRIYTLVGHNGSGKSTLLSILAFLSRPSSGRLRFDGEEVTWRRSELSHLRRQVTLVHQSPYLFSGSVADNLAMALGERVLAREEVRARIAQALEDIQLAGYEQRDARALSGGEARRVAVARALLLERRVLLFDEPLANLDRRSTVLIEELLGRLPASGRTVVLSSHDPEHPRRLGSEVIELQGGQLVAAPAAPLRREPSSPACGAAQRVGDSPSLCSLR